MEKRLRSIKRMDVERELTVNDKVTNYYTVAPFEISLGERIEILLSQVYAERQVSNMTRKVFGLRA